MTVMHLARPWADKVDVIFGDTGDIFPHVIEFVERTCREWGYNLIVAKPAVPADEYIAECGIPVDVLPIWTHRHVAQYLPERRKPAVMMQSGIECCAKLLWEPVQRAVIDSGASLVFRGSKGTDEHVTAPDGTLDKGIEYVSPLWEWTDEMVFEYLNSYAVELPRQYGHGCVHSLDCMKCTAWGDTKAELQRVKFTREFYPVEFEALRERMRLMRDETIRQLEAVEPFINLAED